MVKAAIPSLSDTAFSRNVSADTITSPSTITSSAVYSPNSAPSTVFPVSASCFFYTNGHFLTIIGKLQCLRYHRSILVCIYKLCRLRHCIQYKSFRCMYLFCGIFPRGRFSTTALPFLSVVTFATTSPFAYSL